MLAGIRIFARRFGRNRRADIERDMAAVSFEGNAHSPLTARRPSIPLCESDAIDLTFCRIVLMRYNVRRGSVCGLTQMIDWRSAKCPLLVLSDGIGHPAAMLDT